MATPVATFVQEGFTVDYTPVADVVAGDIVDLGTSVGIALHDIPANTKGALARHGVFDVAKFTGEAIALWAIVYYDAGTNTATGTIAYQEAIMGKCVLAAAAGDATVRVELVPAP
jgi:predicted RecA/RadA family phage recombinase